MKIKTSFNFVLGGQARKLCIDMNMMCEVEEILDVQLMQSEEFWKHLGLRELRALTYAMLYKEIPRPSLINVGDWLSDCDFEEFAKTMTEAWSADFEKDSGKKSSKKEKAQDPTKD